MLEMVSLMGNVTIDQNNEPFLHSHTSFSYLDNIHEFFKELFVAIPTKCKLEMKRLNNSENIAHIIWSSKSDATNIPMGSDTFVFENGKSNFIQ
jgi:hypothetical protein